MANGNDEEYRNPNAEDCVLKPGEKRVRFSLCHVVLDAHVNPGYQSDEDPIEENHQRSESPENNVSQFQQVRTKRRDSVYPIFIMDTEKRIMIGEDSENPSDNGNSHNITPEKDPFAVTDFEIEPSTPWSELTTKEKLEKVGIGLAKAVSLLALLYFFVCSLDLLSKGFRLIGGRTAGEIFQESEILQNPVVGVMMGILTTVLVQSSSTSTSIIVGMVAADFMDVKLAIPLIMGANIGTSITNTIVSFMQAGDKEQFRRAFAGATILDMFNWLTVIVMLVIEVLTDYLYHVSEALVDVLVPDPESGGEVKLLSAITDPFVDLIVQIDEAALDCWSSSNCSEADQLSLIKRNCNIRNTTIDVIERLYDSNGRLLSQSRSSSIQTDDYQCSDEFIFANSSLSDTWIGVIILVGSLIVLCACLILIVKLLSSVLRGHVSMVIKKILNANIPYVPWITGYIAIAVGAIMTFLVQSSSVFTSALTPLVGLGVISLNRVYPLTLGANIGTTTTAVLASFAVDPSSFRPSMQIALCHLFFNLTGILLFYPIPYMRFPIGLSRFLGNVTAEYRWFAIAYMVLMFAVLPAVFILLSMAGSIYVIIVVAIIGVLICFILVVNFLRSRFPRFLPPFLRSWKWLPKPLRSLKPYDDMFLKLACCAKCNRNKVHPSSENGIGDDGSFVFASSPNDTNNGLESSAGRKNGHDSSKHNKNSTMPTTRNRDGSDNEGFAPDS